jgi:hypothetical protein
MVNLGVLVMRQTFQANDLDANDAYRPLGDSPAVNPSKWPHAV